MSGPREQTIGGAAPGAPIPAWVDGALVPVTEFEVHRRGLRHQAVSVFVMRGARTLIRRRSLATYLAPGLWSNACHAHPAWGEAPEACAVRHLRADLGAGGLTLGRRGQAEYRADLGGGLSEHELVEVFRTELYAATHDRRTVGAAASRRTLGGSTRALETLWIDLEDLAAEVTRRAERFTPWLHIALTEHLPLLLD